MHRRYANYSMMVALALAALSATTAEAGPLREFFGKWRQGEEVHDRSGRFEGGEGDAHDVSDLLGGGSSCKEWAAKVASKQRRAGTGPAPNVADITYGHKPKETLDVFYPKNARSGSAPIIFMVHGGGWCVGDKSMKNVTENKVARWVPKGFLFVSVNYPMITEGSMALAQAQSTAKALAYVQRHGQEWGGDTSRIILMGHSAGGHIVSLVNADASLRAGVGAKAVLGTVSIDSGAINTVTQMENLRAIRIKERFAEAFGSDEDGWVQSSPYHQLKGDASPWFGICTRRADDPCGQAEEYAKKSLGMGIRAEVYRVNVGHGKSNAQLGEPGAYTEAVEQFMASLDPVIASFLR